VGGLVSMELIIEKQSTYCFHLIKHSFVWYNQQAMHAQKFRGKEKSLTKNQSWVSLNHPEHGVE